MEEGGRGGSKVEIVEGEEVGDVEGRRVRSGRVFDKVEEDEEVDEGGGRRREDLARK